MCLGDRSEHQGDRCHNRDCPLAPDDELHSVGLRQESLRYEHLGDAWTEVGDRSLSGNYLLRQTAGDRFEDWSVSSSAAPKGWYWSSGFFDVDNDGHQDVFAVNGWITGESKEDL